MDILIIGGTQFVGRHLAEAALEAGHKVTLFNRGKTGPGLYPEAEALVGDRDGNLDALKGRKWDVAFDPSGYLPRVVRQSAELLKDAVGRYVFISSISVYVDSNNADENSPLNVLDDPTSEDIPKHYGALKVACENVVTELYGERGLNARPGFIVGQYDSSPRMPGLLWRYNREGERLAGLPHQPVQMIHSRDMADWLLKAVEAGYHGAYNLTGHPIQMNQLLDTVIEVTGEPTTITYTDDEILKINDVQPVDGVGYWVPLEAQGYMQANVDKVFAAGYTERPLKQTITETLAWLRKDGFQNTALMEKIAARAISLEKEAEILAAWHNRVI
ncbi:MAG: epimerase [Anaerolineaceae bacterium]|nr:epimerase [Anaerolineaceae bacterium]